MDKEKIDYIAGKYLDSVYHIAFNYCKNAEDAEDDKRCTYGRSDGGNEEVYRRKKSKELDKKVLTNKI